MNPLTDQPAEDLTSPGAEQQPQPGQNGAQGGASLEEARDTLNKQLVIERRLMKALETGEAISRKQVQDMVSDFVAARLMPAQKGATTLADLPDKPEQIREWLTKHYREAAQSADQLTQMIQQAEAQQQGQQGGPGAMPEGMDEQKLAHLEALAAHLEGLPDQSGGGGGQPGAAQPSDMQGVETTQPNPAGAPGNALLH